MADSDDISPPNDILSFWFEELQPQDWFNPPPGLDEQCDRRFRKAHLALARGVAPVWRATPENRLAAVILLDQMPRNIYRATPLAFATDGLALGEARLAIEADADKSLTVDQRAFLYLPFEHSENLVDQEQSVRLFSDLGNANYLDFAIRHHEIVAQFGRFPHRNAILGRASTQAELTFLTQPGSGF